MMDDEKEKEGHPIFELFIRINAWTMRENKIRAYYGWNQERLSLSPIYDAKTIESTAEALLQFRRQLDDQSAILFDLIFDLERMLHTDGSRLSGSIEEAKNMAMIDWIMNS